MTPEVIEALEGSIRKWQGIVAGTEVDKGAQNCALCQMFLLRRKSCKGCPVSAATGHSGCRQTPYDAFQDFDCECEDHDPDLIKAAQAEVDFLIGLRP